jgi:hypothetical protein
MQSEADIDAVAEAFGHSGDGRLEAIVAFLALALGYRIKAVRLFSPQSRLARAPALACRSVTISSSSNIPGL